MPWVNIFEHEPCDVVVGLRTGSNDYPPQPSDVFPLDANPETPQVFDSDSGCGLYLLDDGPVIGIPTDSMYAFSWGMYIVPSGGMAGRRFRARMLEQTSSQIDPQPGEGLIQCPGYFVQGCGWMAAFDEASLVPYNPDGNPPEDSDWYEFEVVAAEPDAGDLENTGWVGLFNYDSQDNTATVRGFYEWQVWVDGPDPSEECNFNCECDDPNPSRTLAELRTELMRRAGMSVMTANPPPGMPEMLNSLLQSSQRMLYRQYPVLRTERFFTWDMVQGTRFYDLDANRDVCTKKLDARMLSWVGISDGCDQWRPLVCGIPPECYQVSDQQGVPYRYEIRQCIEVWPAPDSDAYKLRIKGDFGLEPFEADEDQCTIDDEAVFLHALARLKAHLGDPDARNYQQDAIDYIRNLTAGAHLTRRYVPGECPEPPLPKPIWVPKVY